MPVQNGDYVLATKYKDGDPADNWAVGFYDEQIGDRHFVVDNNGNQLRASGFRRVGEISAEFGRWLLDNANELEQSAPGGMGLWSARIRKMFSEIQSKT